MSTEDRDQKADILDALSECEKQASDTMEASRTTGGPVKGLGIVKVPLQPGEKPDMTIAFDARCEVVRGLIRADKVKLVALVTVEDGDEGELTGRTEVLSDNVHFDTGTLLWAVKNDLPGLVANNVYEAIGQCLSEYVRAAMANVAKHVEASQKAGEN